MLPCSHPGETITCHGLGVHLWAKEEKKNTNRDPIRRECEIRDQCCPQCMKGQSGGGGGGGGQANRSM